MDLRKPLLSSGVHWPGGRGRAAGQGFMAATLSLSRYTVHGMPSLVLIGPVRPRRGLLFSLFRIESFPPGWVSGNTPNPNKENIDANLD